MIKGLIGVSELYIKNSLHVFFKKQVDAPPSVMMVNINGQNLLVQVLNGGANQGINGDVNNGNLHNNVNNDQMNNNVPLMVNNGPAAQWHREIDMSKVKGLQC